MDKKAEQAIANQTLQTELTSCRQTTEALCSQLELCTTILNTVSALVVVFDPRGYIVRCNRAFEQTTDCTLDEVRNQLFWDLFLTQDERESVKAVFEKIQQDLTAIAHEHNWITKDGSSQSIAWDYTPCLDSDGTVKYVIGIGKDITSKAQAEFAIQERAAQLEAQNCLLLARDRILEATTSAVNTLLTTDNFDQAVNIALQIVGESLETDRVVVTENFNYPANPSFLYWRVLYEWNSSRTMSQLAYPDVAQGSWEGIETWYEACSRGQNISCLLEDIPEPFRSGQAEIGVKVLNIVPIFVEGKYWGQVGFDDCREAKRRSSAELAVLKIAADCIGSAIQRDRSRRAREEAALQRARELEEHNRVLEGHDRILEATASAANALLTIENFDGAVNTALQIIGESLDTDRLGVIENCNSVSDPLSVRWRVLYEWNSPHVVPQISHPDLVQGSYEGIEEWYHLVCKGEGISRMIDEMPEPFRSGQQKLGVKSLHAVPIVVDGKCWGVVVLDDCREAKPRSAAELAVLKTAAASIGSAIKRDRIRRAREEAELMVLLEREKAASERTAELAKANEALSRSLSRLTDEPNLDAFLGHVLLEITQQVEAAVGYVFLFDAATNTLEKRVGVRNGQTHIGALADDPELFHAPFPANITPGFKYICQTREILFLVDEFREQAWPGTLEWFRSQGSCDAATLALMAGNQSLGQLGLTWFEKTQFKPEKLELIHALANQAALAIQLTRLAEEAKQAAIASEQEKAASERADELAKANEALKRSLDTLATEPELDKFLGYVLTEIVRQAEACAAHLFLYSPEANTLSLCTVFKDGKLYFEPAPDDPQMFQHPFDAGITPAWQSLLVERTICLQTIETQDEWTWEETKAWHIAQKHSAHAGIALVAGDQPIGFLGIAWRDKTTLTTEQTELVHTLSNQATLAIQLTRLAEEAKLAAITREQEKAATERAAELAKANEALKRSLDILATDPDLNRFIGHVLKVAAECLNSFLTEYWWVESEPSNVVHIGLTYFQGQILTPEEQPGHPGLGGLTIKPETIHYENLHHRKRHFVREDILTDPSQEDYAAESSVDVRGWYLARGIRKELNIPLNIGERSIGGLCVYLPVDHHITEQQIELGYALAQQVTLAIQLTRLADEAKLAAIARAEEAKLAAILEERNRIAREIHDTLAQGFTGVIIQLEATKRKISSAQLEAAQTHITRARSLAAEGLSEARRSVRALRPETLESRNLPDALCHLAEQMTCAPATQIIVQIEGSPYALPVEIETNLLRIAQEALTNALRHAQAQTIRLQLGFKTAAVHLHITDDGQGFDPESQLMNTGFGLIGMQERSQRLGGQFTLTSRIGQGTKIIVTVLIAEVESHRTP